MIITNAKYIASVGSDNNSSIQATIDNQVMFVPLDPANRHYQAIQEWAKIDGNKIEEAD